MIITLAGIRTQSGEPPRSTAYYYADLERLKQKNQQNHQHAQDAIPRPENEVQNPYELSEYVESNEVINDGAIREVPPFRDRGRQWSLPEYQTPENARKIPEETYSTAGTFPMPEPKEKEPLLAELEVVGRLPLTQLDSSPGVRRSRSWYLCCPDVADEEISRESSWRYSSLRPVTAPPLPGQNGMTPSLVASASSGRDDAASLRAERDALARALSAERQRAAAAARAHDARLAELHGVIAELVRRRAQDKHTAAIPEEELSDECESTTQPAGELDNDADRSRTEQNDTSSMLSPSELPTPQEPRLEQRHEDDTDDSTQEILEMQIREHPRVDVTSAPPPQEPCDTSLQLSERDSELCLSTARCCQSARGAPAGGAGGPAARAGGTQDTGPSSRQARTAARVRLRRTDDSDSNQHLSAEEAWCSAAAERLALDVSAQAELREALVAASNDECGWRLRWLRARAEARLLRLSLARAAALSRRLLGACGELEAAAVCVCGALAAADRALEAYDVLLALAETDGSEGEQRLATETVALQLLRSLDSARVSASLGGPLLPRGPWLPRDEADGSTEILEVHPSASEADTLDTRWERSHEARLRDHAARLKAETVTLRAQANQPKLFSYHDIDEDELPQATGSCSMAEMEAAVMMQDMLSARESRSSNSHPHSHHDHHSHNEHAEYKSESSRSRRRRERMWRSARAETEL